MRRSRFGPVIAVAALAGVASLAGPASAQSWQILDEIEFAKSMARYRFFDLASAYLEKLGKTDLSKEDKLSLLYARAFLSKVAGEHAVGLDARASFLESAISTYDEFLRQADPQNDQRDAALTEMAESHRLLGALLAQRLARGNAPAEAQANAEKSFRKAVEELNKIYNERTTKLRELLADPEAVSSDEQTEKKYWAYQPLFELAQTYYEFAQLYGPEEFNRKDYLQKSLEAASELLWEIEEITLFTFQVYYYQALANLALGNYPEAAGIVHYSTNPEEGLPSILENNENLPAAVVEQITTEMERNVLALARHLNEQGQYEQAEQEIAALSAYYDRFKNRGVTRGNAGDECLLELGVARIRQGKPEGRVLLEEVAKRHTDDAVAERAATYIARILEGSDGSTGPIPASLWVKGAEGDTAAGRPLDAIEKYHRALAALDTITDPAERTKTALSCWNSIGKIYRGERRYVEAALAFRAGLDVQGEGKTQEDVEALGTAWFAALTLRHKETKSADDGRAKDDAMRELGRLGLENMAFLLARDEFEAARILSAETHAAERKESFENAQRQFKAVKADDPNYERALIYVARVEGEQGNYERAIKHLEDFLERTRDKRYDPGLDRKKMQSRDIAKTEAVYYMAQYQVAAQHHADAVKTLEGFEEQFPEQESFFPSVNFLRIRALVSTEPPSVAEAEALYEAKKGGLLPLEGSFFLARALLDRAERLAAEGKRDEAVPYWQKGGRIMYEYCEASGFDSYANLWQAANAASQVAQAQEERWRAARAAGKDASRAEATAAWGEVELLCAKIIQVFGNHPDAQDSVNRNVKRMYSDALLAQDKFTAAAPVFKELLNYFPEDKGILKRAAFCFGGRVDVKDGSPQEISGSGDYVEAIRLWDTIAERGFSKEEKYSKEWFEAKFYTIYARYRAREVKAEYANEAKSLFDNLESTVLSFYEPAEYAEVLGGQEWVRRYDYLRTQLR